MPARALFDCLPDFGERPESMFPADPPDFGDMPMTELEPSSTPDIDSIVAAEVAAVEHRIRAEMEAERELVLAAERDRHAVEIQHLQATLGEAAAAKIAVSFEEAVTRLCGLTTAAVARLLSSILADDMARRSVEEISSRIGQMMADRDVMQIQVTGPQSLIEAVAVSLGPLAARCDFSDAAGFDVIATVDGTILETRLAEWSALVGEAVS